MFYTAKSLQNYQLQSLDGEIGKVKDFYFDDRHWAIRYLIAETGNWLTGKQVLISPYALTAVHSEDTIIDVNLTKKQMEDSPSLNTDKPVSRQYESDFFGYYGWPAYWTGSYMWGDTSYMVRDPEKWENTPREEKSWDTNLRSTNLVSGYHIHAEDGDIGHVEDFIIDEETWAIRYLIIDTSNWWTGKKVLISPLWIDSIDWSEGKVTVALSRETIRQSPEYREGMLLTREFEIATHQYYKRQEYWIGKPMEEDGDL